MVKNWFYHYDHYASLSYDFSARKLWTYMKNRKKKLVRQEMSYIFFGLLVLAENKLKITYKLEPLVSMFRLSRWQCHENVFVLILLWYSMWRHCACSGHKDNCFLRPGQATGTSAQSIFLRCICSKWTVGLLLYGGEKFCSLGKGKHSPFLSTIRDMRTSFPFLSFKVSEGYTLTLDLGKMRWVFYHCATDSSYQ